MKKLVFFLWALSVGLNCLGQQKATTEAGKKVMLKADGTWSYINTKDTAAILKPVPIDKLEIPFSNVISHTGYSFSYNETHEQADWVAYELTKEKTKKMVKRKDHFRPDSAVKTGTATNKDYEKSGYDRGHLAPSADMCWSFTAMDESFYFSNMSPQNPSFNRGIWSKLEALVRSWAAENESIYIVTGPVLTEGLPTIGDNKVSVPQYFYKVILDYTEPDIKGIGFILPNAASSESLQKFAVSIDSVENFTGIDFFPLLPDEQEKIIEKKLCIPCWTWKVAKTEED